MPVELMIPNTIMAGKKTVGSRLAYIEENLMHRVLQPIPGRKLAGSNPARYANMIIGHTDRARFHAL